MLKGPKPLSMLHPKDPRVSGRALSKCPDGIGSAPL